MTDRRGFLKGLAALLALGVIPKKHNDAEPDFAKKIGVLDVPADYTLTTYSSPSFVVLNPSMWVYEDAHGNPIYPRLYVQKDTAHA